jgi:hypothetical protein
VRLGRQKKVRQKSEKREKSRRCRFRTSTLLLTTKGKSGNANRPGSDRGGV